MKTETPQMDWQQVAINGGPPCFAVGVDAQGWYCGRAQRWDGHDYDHKFVSLDDLLNAERERCAKIVNDARVEGGADLRELVSRIRGKD